MCVHVCVRTCACAHTALNTQMSQAVPPACGVAAHRGQQVAPHLELPTGDPILGGLPLNMALGKY